MNSYNQPTPLHTQPFYGSLDSVRDNPGEPLPESTFCHLLDFLEQNEDNTGKCTNNLDGLPSRLTGASISAIPTIFTQDALPYTTLPIYPGLGQAPNMLACIPSGLVHSVALAVKQVFAKNLAFDLRHALIWRLLCILFLLNIKYIYFCQLLLKAFTPFTVI